MTCKSTKRLSRYLHWQRRDLHWLLCIFLPIFKSRSGNSSRWTQTSWKNCKGTRQECQEARWNVGQIHKSNESEIEDSNDHHFCYESKIRHRNRWSCHRWCRRFIWWLQREEEIQEKKYQVWFWWRMTCTPSLVLDQFMGLALIFHPRPRRGNETLT